MANWCWNNVNFTGEETRINELEKLFEEMAYRENETTRGQLPDFVDEAKGGWFFEISWNEGSLAYQTKWSPNTEQLIGIADQYDVGFVHNYEEMGMGIYGEASYQDGVLTDICLDDQDFQQYDYDEETDRYTFEGEAYDGEWDILETLLDRKKEISRQEGLPGR